MADLSCSGRRCFGFGFVGVSKVGPSGQARPPVSMHGTHADESTNWNAATMVVVLIAAVLVVGMVAVAIVLRRRRIRAERARSSGEDGNVVKEGRGEADVDREGGRSAETVELVVMAGETQPTFLAHPAPAPTNHSIQCPPLMLPKDLPQ